MKTLVTELARIGETVSLKQHVTVKEMLEFGNQNVDLIVEAFSRSKELFCLIEPEDDQD